MTAFFADTPYGGGRGAIAGGLIGGKGAKIEYSFGNAHPHGTGMTPPYIELTPVSFETTINADSPMRISVAELEHVMAELKRRQTGDEDDR